MRPFHAALFAGFLAAGFTACETQGPAEKKGEEIGEAVDETREDMAEQADEIQKDMEEGYE